jgi:RimJ/RimL family protein N-acetyltransferase
VPALKNDALMNYILETERLALKEFTLNDTDFIIRLLNSPGWLEYIGDRNVKTTQDANAYLENGPLKSYRENGFGLCMVETINERKPVGMCGIIKRDTLPNPDIGFAFLQEYISKGYGFEIAAATLAYAKNELKLPKISAITVPSNERSIKLLEKLGFQFISKTKNLSTEEELLLYEWDTHL